MAGNQSLKLDVYDAAALPALTLLGSCEFDADAAGRAEVSEILWPQANRPCVVVESQPYPFLWGGGVVFDSVAPPALPLAESVVAGSSLMVREPFYMRLPDRQPRLVVFDLTNPAQPSAAAPIALGANPSSLAPGHAATAGLVAVGVDTWLGNPVPDQQNGWLLGSASKLDVKRLALSHSVRLIEVPAVGSPVLRPAIDLPGSLFAVTEFDRNGFLAFSKCQGSQGALAVQVSACDGRDAFLVSTIDKVDGDVVAAAGRRLFIAGTDQLRRFRLDDSKRLLAEAPVALGWQAYDLQWRGATLLGTSGQRVFALEGNALIQWQLGVGATNLSEVISDEQSGWLVPLAGYGIEALTR